MRILAALMLVACAGLALTSLSTAAPATSLRITYWAKGAGSAQAVRWTLRCAPAGGTQAKPAAACARLSSDGWRLFAPVPKNVACTEIFGGPQAALVVGVVQGRHVWARFQRRDGCEIARWNRLAPWLLPAGGTT